MGRKEIKKNNIKQKLEDVRAKRKNYSRVGDGRDISVRWQVAFPEWSITVDLTGKGLFEQT